MSALTEVNLPRAVPRLERHEVLGRLLFSITGLRQREALSALMLAANVFLLLGSYYVLKTVREAWILNEGGAAVKSYSAAGQALLLLAVIPAYGYVASRVNRLQLISRVER